MSQTTEELKNELRRSVSLLHSLRDEIRVSLHLAGMEAKDQWAKLEPRLNEVERAAHDVSETSRTAVADTVAHLKKLRDSLR